MKLFQEVCMMNSTYYIVLLILVFDIGCLVYGLPAVKRTQITYSETFVRELHPRRNHGTQNKQSQSAASSSGGPGSTNTAKSKTQKSKNDSAYDYQLLEYLYDYDFFSDHKSSSVKPITIPSANSFQTATESTVNEETTEAVTTPSISTKHVQSTTPILEFETKTLPSQKNVNIVLPASKRPFRYTTNLSPKIKKTKVESISLKKSKEATSRKSLSRLLAEEKERFERRFTTVGGKETPSNRRNPKVGTHRVPKYRQPTHRQSRSRNNLRLKEVLVLQIEPSPETVNLTSKNSENMKENFRSILERKEKPISGNVNLETTTKDKPTTFIENTTTNGEITSTPVSKVLDASTDAEVTTQTTEVISETTSGTVLDTTLLPSVNDMNSTTTLSPLDRLTAQLGTNPMGTNPIGVAPFGVAPKGSIPFGLAPTGISPQGVTVNMTNPTTTNNETIAQQEERYHVQVKKPDGSINGDYVVVDHSTGNLNGVRYEAIDGADQALIQKALLSFLSLDPRLDPRLEKI